MVNFPTKILTTNSTLTGSVEEILSRRCLVNFHIGKMCDVCIYSVDGKLSCGFLDKAQNHQKLCAFSRDTKKLLRRPALPMKVIS